VACRLPSSHRIGPRSCRRKCLCRASYLQTSRLCIHDGASLSRSSNRSPGRDACLFAKAPHTYFHSGRSEYRIRLSGYLSNLRCILKRVAISRLWCFHPPISTSSWPRKWICVHHSSEPWCHSSSIASLSLPAAGSFASEILHTRGFHLQCEIR